MANQYITIKQASKILGVSPLTLRNWDKNGLLVAVRLGEKKVRRYRKIDIENFIGNKKKWREGRL